MATVDVDTAAAHIQIPFLPHDTAVGLHASVADAAGHQEFRW